MIRTFFSKFLAALSALFWADKKRLFLGFLASFWAIQHIACAYGCGDDSCDENNVDPSLMCSPVFDAEKMSGQDYDECEQAIAENLTKLSECNAACADETLLNKGTIETPIFESAQLYCLPDAQASVYEGCGNVAVDGLLNKIYDQMVGCSMEHFKDDGTVSRYKCENGEIVSVEEGERRAERVRKEMGW